jgi:putative ABC transport system substrate-binding protein
LRRREFLITAGAAAAFPRLTFAQQIDRPRIAVVSLPLSSRYGEAIVEGLADYGYVDGTNVTIEFFTAPTWRDLPASAMNAVASLPDIILTNGASATEAASSLTSTIPIVFASLTDPVGIGLVASRGRPGGNITGNSLLTADLIGRQLTMAKQIIPIMRRLVVLSIAGAAPSAILADQVVDAATQLDLDPVIIHFVPGQDFATQFQRILAVDAEAVYVPSNGYFANNGALLLELQARHGLPMIGTAVIEGGTPPFTGIVAYGASVTAAIRQSGAFIDAILKGARPGDLVVKLPTVFDLAVDLRTAKALGLTIPPSMLAEATLVVE